MALVRATCTQCNGELQFDESVKGGFCLYCGVRFVSDDVVSCTQNYNVTNNIGNIQNAVINQAGPTEQSLLQRSQDLFVDGEIDRAKEYAEKVLEFNSRNQDAKDILKAHEIYQGLSIELVDLHKKGFVCYLESIMLGCVSSNAIEEQKNLSELKNGIELMLSKQNEKFVKVFGWSNRELDILHEYVVDMVSGRYNVDYLKNKAIAKLTGEQIKPTKIVFEIDTCEVEAGSNKASEFDLFFLSQSGERLTTGFGKSVLGDGVGNNSVYEVTLKNPSDCHVDLVFEFPCKGMFRAKTKKQKYRFYVAQSPKLALAKLPNGDFDVRSQERDVDDNFVKVSLEKVGVI